MSFSSRLSSTRLAIRDGQLNSVRELATVQQKLLRQSNKENQPVISAVKSYPDNEEILKEINGEENDKTGFTRRINR